MKSFFKLAFNSITLVFLFGILTIPLVVMTLSGYKTVVQQNPSDVLPAHTQTANPATEKITNTKETTSTQNTEEILQNDINLSK